jgi:hypothetical protein
MRRFAAAHILCSPVSERRQINALRQACASAKQDRADCHVHLVDQAGLQILTYRRRAAAKAA